MGIQHLEDALNPVSNEIRSLASHDPHDRWLIEEVGFSEQAYQNATHVLIGCPQDEGVRRNNGRVGAALAPDKIRERLYKLQVPETPEIKLYDAGNINIDFFDFTDTELREDIPEITKETKDHDGLERAHKYLTKAVKQFLKDGKKVIVLGGGNDISYADVRALSELHGHIAAINIDAHLDMRIADKMTSGTPYRRLIEDGLLHPHHFHEFGIRPETNAAFYLKSATEMGVNLHYFQDIIVNDAASVFGNLLKTLSDSPLFLGLDMDAIHAADAPGVSASSPIGFTAKEVSHFIRKAAQLNNLLIFEITEVNPRYDIDGQTSKLAAHFIYEFLLQSSAS